MSTSLSLTSDSLPSDSLPDEVRARSSFPWVWFGFFFVAAFLIEETLDFALDLDRAITKLVLLVIGIAGTFYWFFCVHRFHKILGEISRGQYPVDASEAVWKHFVPLYNIVWCFQWPGAMSNYLNRRERVRMVSGYLLGFFVLASTAVGRFFDGAFGMTGLFLVGLYMSAKLRKHVESIGGVPKDLLPPNPEPGMFGPTAPTELRSETPRAELQRGPADFSPAMDWSNAKSE